MDESGVRLRDGLDRLSQSCHRHLGAGAHFVCLTDCVGCRSVGVCVHDIRDVNEISGLGAVAVDLDWLVGKRLFAEDRDDGRIISTGLSGPIDIELPELNRST